MNKIKKEYKILILIGIILIIIDQALKIYAMNNNNKEIIDGILRITISESQNELYEIKNNSAIIYLISNLIIIIVAFKFIISENQFIDKKTKIFLSLIIAGGISNCIDRIFRGYVIEYIDFTNILKIPIFNLADICILIGWIAIAAIFASFTAKELKERKSK